MENNILNFNDGVEALKINGDENRVIRFNPTNPNLLQKIDDVNKSIIDEIKKLDEDKTISDEQRFVLADEYIRKQIDYIFGAGTSVIVFENTSSIATVNGQYIYENFLIAVMEYMTQKVKIEAEASKKRVEEYTKKAEELKK